MKNIWKWVLGILVVLVIVAVVGAAAFMWRGHMNVAFSSGRGMPFGFNQGQDPMMRGGFGLFGGLFALGGLLKLAFFGALLYGAYWLGKRNTRVVMDTPPAAPVQPTPKENE